LTGVFDALTSAFSQQVTVEQLAVEDDAWILLVGYPRLLKEGSDLSVAR
jgi:hypothetical protein